MINRISSFSNSSNYNRQSASKVAFKSAGPVTLIRDKSAEMIARLSRNNTPFEVIKEHLARQSQLEDDFLKLVENAQA